MQLNEQELLELYEAVIKPSGHPNPLSYLTRALLFSEGDPDYVGIDRKLGFMPVLPEDALREVGAQEVASLQNNIIATIAMERNLFVEFESVDRMIIAFHFGRDEAVRDEFSGEQKELLAALPDAEQATLNLLYPPLATVDDVINILSDAVEPNDLSKKKMDFFNFLLKRA